MARDDDLPLRERKKLRTRRRLVAVAGQMFAERGYAATTLDDISDALEIRTPTLLRYFPSKAHLAHAPTLAYLERFRSAMEDAEREQSAIDVWRDFVAEMSAPRSAELLRPTRRWMAKEPTLRAMAAEINSDFERALAQGIAQDDGVDPATDVFSHLLAALLSAGNRAVYRGWLANEGSNDSLQGNQLAALDAIVATFPNRADYERRIDSAFVADS